MPLLESLIGDVQVQERRPKSWNEPRRKRLSFVRPHNPHSRQSSSSSNPDEWALVPRQGNARHYRNDAETWDLRRFEAQQRFNDAAFRQRDREHNQKVHFMHQLYGPPPDLQQIHDHGRRQGMLEGGIQEIRPHHRHDDSDNEIVEIIHGSDFDDDDDWDDHHGHDRGRPRRVPLSIEHDHDRGRAIHDVTNGRRKRSKSKNKKSRKGKKSNKRDDSGSDDDDRERIIFAEGVRVGIKASRERGGHGGGSDRGSPRDRRRFLRDDDSDDSMNFRHRRRSQSRGRHPWFGM